MKTNSKTFFYFTRSERNGIAWFSLLCVFLFWLPSRFSQWKSSERTDFSPFQQEIAEFQARLQEPPAVRLAADPLDPNVAREEEWVAIGLPPRIARTIIRYMEKGGRFRYREDLKKIYSIDEELYEAIAPFIDLPVAGGESAPSAVLVRQEQETNLEPFDPNRADREQLLRLGLPDRVVQTMLNYRARGGIFHRPQDLQKIFGLSEELYERLLPYVRLTGEAVESIDASFSRYPGPGEKLDVNEAQAVDWQRLPGIGPVLSQRIVKFRDKLGGFIDVAQVAETYGLPDSTFQRIAGLLTASAIEPTLHVNRASVEDLQSHPYLDWRQAKAIVQYRILHGPFRNLDDFTDVKVLTPGQRARIAPYLSFQE